MTDAFMGHLRDTDKVAAKLAYERCEQYVLSARAMLHIKGEKYEAPPMHRADPENRNLWHILDLISMELTVLNEMLDSSLDAAE